jgi:hypothetical protein
MSQKQQLLIANTIIEHLKTQALPYNEYFEQIGFKYGSDQLTLNNKIAITVQDTHDTTYIYGMFPEQTMSIDSILNILPPYATKTTTVNELKEIIEWIQSKRLINLSEIKDIQQSLIASTNNLTGYCLTSGSKIFGAEFVGYDEEKIKLNKLVFSLRNELIEATKSTLELQEKFITLKNTVDTQNAVLNNKISLSWT